MRHVAWKEDDPTFSQIMTLVTTPEGGLAGKHKKYLVLILMYVNRCALADGPQTAHHHDLTVRRLAVEEEGDNDPIGPLELLVIHVLTYEQLAHGYSNSLL